MISNLNSVRKCIPNQSPSHVLSAFVQNRILRTHTEKPIMEHKKVEHKKKAKEEEQNIHPTVL